LGCGIGPVSGREAAVNMATAVVTEMIRKSIKYFTHF
jgi:hypothetical protein